MITPILRVHDIDLSLMFYLHILGFEGGGGLPGADGKAAYGEVYLGEARIMFTRRCTRAQALSGVELYLDLPAHIAIEDLYTRLKALEVYFVEDMHPEMWGDTAFTILDLDGNRLTFAQPVKHPARSETSARVFEQIA